MIPNVFHLRRRASRVLVLLSVCATLSGTAAQAMKIKDLTTPGGIKAWLVEEHSVPLMAMRFSFKGGSAQDPVGKEGIAHFLTGMMDEGAGDLNAEAFQGRVEELAMRMSFEDGKDQLYGSFETLTENRAETVKLLKSALNKPRFDADAHERVRAQLLSGLACCSTQSRFRGQRTIGYAERVPRPSLWTTLQRRHYGQHEGHRAG